MKKNMNKILAVALAVTMLALVGVSATLAWLYDTDEKEVNSFTVGKVYVELTESKNEFHIVPSLTETKQPQVTVLAGSEDSYVFIKVDENKGALTEGVFANYVVYDKAAGWTELTKTATGSIWYRLVEGAEIGTAIDVLKDNQVSYPETITNAMLLPVQTGNIDLDADDDDAVGENDATEAGAGSNLPTLTFTAYAIQKLGSNDAASAYEKLQASFNQQDNVVLPDIIPAQNAG